LPDGILVERNQFDEMPGPVITATSFENLIISHNTVVNREKPTVPEKMRGSIRAELGTNLWVEGNDWTTQRGLDTPSVFYDADTTRSIVCRANELRS
jgi:hypothetical protein